ncbi:MAG TPA: DUF4037 domain-containing protein [Streptosporangiaceae bacterium]|nr:DUF4037 domain-containing protein [Streptosporangiaceae bacterium]
MTVRFIPGLELAGEYYAEVVGPLLDQAYPGLPYSAGLLGWGSEVLGFDSQRSTDHNWGPRLQVFLPAGPGPDPGEVTALLARQLPETFRGYPTVFPSSQDPAAAARHWVEVTHLRPWLQAQLGFDATQPVSTADWLATPTQRLAEVTAGAVFHDGLGELAQVRARLAWYPHDVWRYVLACQWQRIAQEEAFPGRCSEAGDELGSAVVAARLARDLMRLCLLMARHYPPYSKWLGTALAHLPEAAELAPSLHTAVTATDWQAREHHLCQAYEMAATLHNQLGLTPRVAPHTRPFHDRPYQVLDAGRFVAALRAAIDDPQVRQLPAAGAIDQFIDSTDALGDAQLRRALQRMNSSLLIGIKARTY